MSEYKKALEWGREAIRWGNDDSTKYQTHEVIPLAKALLSAEGLLKEVEKDMQNIARDHLGTYSARAYLFLARRKETIGE